MKASKGKTIAVIRNQHTKAEMREIEKSLLDPNAKFITLQESFEISRNENLHQNR
jgi:hypothetical protein